MNHFTENEAAAYDLKISNLYQYIMEQPDAAKLKYHLPEILCNELVPGNAANARLFALIKSAKPFLFNYTALDKAMVRATKAFNAAIASVERGKMTTERLTESQQIESWYTREPTNERDFVNMFMTGRGYDMKYDRQFFKMHDDGHRAIVRLIDIMHDLQLTAAALCLTKPRGDLLGMSNLDRALSEWASRRRLVCRDEVARRVMTKLSDTSKATTMADFDRLCEAVFLEPAFAGACLRKVIWSTKRKMLELPIPQPHMIVLVGTQNSCKTWLCRQILSVIQELSAEVGLSEIVDARHIDLLEYYLLFPDEMTHANSIDMATLKTFITGSDSARRPMYTNIAEKVRINATLLGTANHSLGTKLFDSSGMRRFGEVNVKTRAQIAPHWDNVKDFDFKSLWQSVEPDEPDPLIPFADQLKDKQEEIRNQDNVEAWLAGFEFDRNVHEYRYETTSAEQVEFWANSLYLIFKEWEAEYDRAYRGTSLQRWGRDMKNLIDQGGIAQNWSQRMTGNKKVYTLKFPKAAEKNSVVPFDPDVKLKTAIKRKYQT